MRVLNVWDSRSVRGCLGLALACLLAVSPSLLLAQAPDTAVALVPGETVLITPQGRYDAGLVHRSLLGGNHRSLWETPIEVEVLDLSTFAGGLTPVRRGGGLQTRSLRFQSAEGPLYSFRALDKDASRTLDPALRQSIAARVLQDQISALLPVSALVVSPLLEAAGVLHADPVLRVMPDDPALGEFREEFGGLLGLVEVRPDEGEDGEPSFAGAARVTGSERFLELLEDDPEHQVDPEAFLRARLLDFFVGDWDRHPDQWRWAEFEEGSGSRWEPIPRDRDWALARMEGLLVWVAGFLVPHYHGFRHDYHSVFAQSWSGRALDRQLLSGMTRESFAAVAEDLKGRLSDDQISSAVGRLPDSYRTQIGAELESALMNRRDGLDRIAMAFYDHLAGWVDIWATDEDEVAEVQRSADGTVLVTVREEDASDPYYSRTFLPNETNEIRLFLRGGEDKVEVAGDGPADIEIRLMGGGGDDEYADLTSAGGVGFYDHRGDNTFVAGAGTHIDETDYDDPDDPSSATHQARARDWGSRTLPVPYMLFDSDLGVVLGMGFSHTRYGFRHFPHRTFIRGSVGLSTGSGRPRAELDLNTPLAGPNVRLHLNGLWSGAEVNRFFGFGNGTINDGPSAFFEAEREEIRVDATLQLRLGERATVEVGPRARLFERIGETGRLIDDVQPYGNDQEFFNEFGLIAAFNLDTRPRIRHARGGETLWVEGRWYPELGDVESAFAGVKAVAAAYRSLDVAMEPTLAVRVGGERLSGRFPYQEAAYIGGGTDLRGFRNQRFAGRGAAFANVELRLFLGEFFFQVPSDFGVFGLWDTGRVFDDADTDTSLHNAFGGGVWFAFLDRANTLSVGFASSAEDQGLYVKAGFLF